MSQVKTDIPGAAEVQGLLEEYRSLRGEIMNCINLNNTLATFMATTVGLIFTFSLVYQQPLLFLLPFVVIIPFQCRIFHYRQNMMKISAYMVAYLEPRLPGIRWETHHKGLSALKEPVLIRGCRNYEGALLALACLVLLVVFGLITYTPATLLAHLGWSLLVLAFALVATAYTFYLSWKTNQSLAAREMYIAQWQAIVAHDPEAP